MNSRKKTDHNYGKFKCGKYGVPGGNYLFVEMDKNDRIMALRKKNLYGMQFHAESAMTQNGYQIISEVLTELPLQKATQA